MKARISHDPISRCIAKGISAPSYWVVEMRTIRHMGGRFTGYRVQWRDVVRHGDLLTVTLDGEPHEVTLFNEEARAFEPWVINRRKHKASDQT